jgi:hypothetical protein
MFTAYTVSLAVADNTTAWLVVKAGVLTEVDVIFVGDCPAFWQDENKEIAAAIHNNGKLILEKFFITIILRG